jgi:hypothetical protein
MHARKKSLFAIFAILLLLGMLELCAFAFVTMRPDLFDQRERFMARLTAEAFDLYLARASNALGWENPSAPTVVRNCVGDRIVYTFNSDRDRVHNDAPQAEAQILIAGDSYTRGDDHADEHSVPAVLERITGRRVANLGVGGYGADQALLRLEKSIGRFPQARIAILAIMYDDVERMMTSYRPLMFEYPPYFQLKPYMRAGKFHPIPGGTPFDSLSAARDAIAGTFDTDYWRRARARFPYTLSVVEMSSLPSFWMPIMRWVGRRFGQHHYEFFFGLRSTQENLRAIYQRFAALVEAHSLAGIVAFIPGGPGDGRAGNIAILAASDDQRARLLFRNVQIADWSSYIWTVGCHPSAAGYRMIANNLARAVQDAASPVK